MHFEEYCGELFNPIKKTAPVTISSVSTHGISIKFSVAKLSPSRRQVNMSMNAGNVPAMEDCRDSDPGDFSRTLFSYFLLSRKTIERKGRKGEIPWDIACQHLSISVLWSGEMRNLKSDLFPSPALLPLKLVDWNVRFEIVEIVFGRHSIKNSDGQNLADEPGQAWADCVSS